MSIPHRSTEPARPRAPDTLIDFHTGMHDRERAAEDRRPDEPEVERQVPDLDPRRTVEGQRGRAREQLALGEEELPAVDEGAC